MNERASEGQGQGRTRVRWLEGSLRAPARALQRGTLPLPLLRSQPGLFRVLPVLGSVKPDLILALPLYAVSEATLVPAAETVQLPSWMRGSESGD